MTVAAMKWMKTLHIGLALLAVLVVPAAALAQDAGSGAINSRVVGADDTPLPGVLVFVEGPLGTHTRVTPPRTAPPAHPAWRRGSTRPPTADLPHVFGPLGNSLDRG